MSEEIKKEINREFLEARRHTMGAYKALERIREILKIDLNVTAGTVNASGAHEKD